MSMKSQGLLLAMATMAIAQSTTHSYGPRGCVSTGDYFTGKRRKEDPSLPLRDSITKPEIPKGHKYSSVEFIYNIRGYKLSIILEISGGSEKSFIKRANSMDRFLEDYVTKTPIEDLIKFNQFNIVKNEDTN
jgi:hypothetical protein